MTVFRSKPTGPCRRRNRLAHAGFYVSPSDDAVSTLIAILRKLAVSIAFFGSITMASAGELHDAAKSGDLSRIGELLDAGVDIDAPDAFGTALHWAILNRHDDAALLLIARGARLDVATDTLGTPLHAAADRGLDAQVALLLDHGAAPDLRDRQDKTALHFAALRGKLNVARLLLEHGADANALGTNDHGMVWGEGTFTPLHLAIYGKNAEVAELIVSFGGGPVQTGYAEGLIEKGDAAAGKAVAQWCVVCHVVEPGQPQPVQAVRGPTLIGVVGRKVASVAGFDYSSSLRELGGTWDETRLYSFIAHPMMAVPGTTMVFERIPEGQPIADLIAFLKEQTF